MAPGWLKHVDCAMSHKCISVPHSLYELKLTARNTCMDRIHVPIPQTKLHPLEFRPSGTCLVVFDQLNRLEQTRREAKQEQFEYPSSVNILAGIVGCTMEPKAQQRSPNTLRNWTKDQMFFSPNSNMHIRGRHRSIQEPKQWDRNGIPYPTGTPQRRPTETPTPTRSGLGRRSVPSPAPGFGAGSLHLPHSGCAYGPRQAGVVEAGRPLSRILFPVLHVVAARRLSSSDGPSDKCRSAASQSLERGEEHVIGRVHSAHMYKAGRRTIVHSEVDRDG